MTTASVLGALDQMAVVIATISEIKACYTATGSGVSSASRPIPQSIDDGPVGVMWIGSAQLQAGNAEVLLFRPTCDVWVRATNAGFANKSISAMPDRFIAKFRTNLGLADNVTRCLMTGWDEPFIETSNKQEYLVLPITFELLILHFAHDYALS